MLRMFHPRTVEAQRFATLNSRQRPGHRHQRLFLIAPKFSNAKVTFLVEEDNSLQDPDEFRFGRRKTPVGNAVRHYPLLFPAAPLLQGDSSQSMRVPVFVWLHCTPEVQSAA